MFCFFFSIPLCNPNSPVVAEEKEHEVLLLPFTVWLIPSTVGKNWKPVRMLYVFHKILLPLTDQLQEESPQLSKMLLDSHGQCAVALGLLPGPSIS